MLASLYNGNVHVWNYESQTLVKSFEVCTIQVDALLGSCVEDDDLSGVRPAGKGDSVRATEKLDRDRVRRHEHQSI